MLERKGKQYRLRVLSPSKFQKKTLRTKDTGKKGGLQLITGRLKGRKKTSVQAIRLSTKDFRKVKSKLIPKTKRGKRELTSLRRRKTGRISKIIKRHF